MIYRQYSFWLLYILFLFTGCARQTSPTGGPMDTIPPKLLSSNPRHEQTNFKGNSIDLYFNEMVELATPKEQLIITPSIGKDYKIIAKNEKVTISWNKPLKDSTTYTFTFREAVKDVTERTPAENLRLAFSTGNYIDSLSIRGEVKTILEQTVVKDATVALQPYADTFSILKHQPTYITKTNDEGEYVLENLKPGRYILYALTDQNRNLFVDTRTERYGFLEDPIILDSATRVNIGLVRTDLRPLKLTSARPYNTYFNIKTSKNIESVKLRTPADTSITYAFGNDNSNILLYNKFTGIDSLELHVSLIDSIQNRFDTTLYAKFSKQQATPEKFDVSLNKSMLNANKGLITGGITLSKPIGSFNFDSIFFQVDSLNIIKFERSNFTYDSLHKILSFSKKIDKTIYQKPPSTDKPTVKDSTAVKVKPLKKLNTLYFGKGAILSIENDSSKMLKQRLSPLQYEDMGVISISVQSARTTSTVVELINTKGDLIAKRINQSAIDFEDLPPDDYQIRVIIDTNKNGRWDSGNYLKKETPERIVYYENDNKERTVKLKANFEIGPLLITY